MKNLNISPLMKERRKMEELLAEAKGLNNSRGREVVLKVVNPTGVEGKEMIYLSVNGDNVGLSKASKEETAEVVSLVSEGRYRAYIVGVSDDEKNLVIEVEETEEARDNLADKAKAKTAREKLENLLGKDETVARIDYMATFGLTEKNYPALFSDFLQKVADTVESTLAANEKLPEKPKVLFITADKKNDGNPLLSLSRGWVIWRPCCLEGQKGLGKDVAFESFSWLTGCRLITLQWNGRTTRGDAFCHESTDNSSKEGLSVEGLVEALNWFTGSVFSKLFKREEKAEKATNFILNTLKSLSPSLKMVNGPILESLELASRGVGVIFLNDEMNLGEPNFQTGSLNFLADGHTAEIYVGGKGVVPICRDYFYMGATQNGVGGDYVGTHKLNDALASRFKFVKMAKPSSILGILRTAGKQVDEATYLIIDNIYKEYMSGVESGTYPMSSLNIRGMKSAIEEVYYGASVKTAVAENINNSVQSDDDTDMLNTVVDTLVP